jgi:hypothetical protein
VRLQKLSKGTTQSQRKPCVQVLCQHDCHMQHTLASWYEHGSLRLSRRTLTACTPGIHQTDLVSQSHQCIMPQPQLRSMRGMHHAVAGQPLRAAAAASRTMRPWRCIMWRPALALSPQQRLLPVSLPEHCCSSTNLLVAPQGFATPLPKCSCSLQAIHLTLRLH